MYLFGKSLNEKKGWSTNTHPSEHQDSVHYDTQVGPRNQVKK